MHPSVHIRMSAATHFQNEVLQYIDSLGTRDNWSE
jgi:hypothetical protein